jgi:hypothetical protein
MNRSDQSDSELLSPQYRKSATSSILSGLTATTDNALALLKSTSADAASLLAGINVECVIFENPEPKIDSEVPVSVAQRQSQPASRERSVPTSSGGPKQKLEKSDGNTQSATVERIKRPTNPDKKTMFVRRGNKLLGPVSIRTIEKNIANGRIQKTDKVASTKEGPWTRFAESAFSQHFDRRTGK